MYLGVLPLLLGLALAGLSPPASRAVTTERVVVDRHTGLALYGVDPVGYFTDGKPVPGLADFEYGYAGAIWRFHNEGNRAAFAADPDVYMPRYGGYDPDYERPVPTPRDDEPAIRKSSWRGNVPGAASAWNYQGRSYR